MPSSEWLRIEKLKLIYIKHLVSGTWYVSVTIIIISGKTNQGSHAVVAKTLGLSQKTCIWDVFLPLITSCLNCSELQRWHVWVSLTPPSSKDTCAGETDNKMCIIATIFGNLLYASVMLICIISALQQLFEEGVLFPFYIWRQRGSVTNPGYHVERG